MSQRASGLNTEVNQNAMDVKLIKLTAPRDVQVRCVTSIKPE